MREYTLHRYRLRWIELIDRGIRTVKAADLGDAMRKATKWGEQLGDNWLVDVTDDQTGECTTVKGDRRS